MKIEKRNVLHDSTGILGYIWFDHTDIDMFLSAIKEHELSERGRAVAYEIDDVNLLYYKKKIDIVAGMIPYILRDYEQPGFNPCMVLYIT